MKINFYKITSLILLLALTGFIYFFLIRGTVIRDAKDARITIIISENNHDFVMEEMRVFLENIQKISEGIETDNKQLIIEAGFTSGDDVANHVPI